MESHQALQWIVRMHCIGKLGGTAMESQHAGTAVEIQQALHWRVSRHGIGESAGTAVESQQTLNEN